MTIKLRNIVGGILAALTFFFLGVLVTVLATDGFSEVITAEKMSVTDTLRVVEDSPGFLFGSRQHVLRFEHSSSGDLKNLFTMPISDSMIVSEAKILEVSSGVRVVFINGRPELTFNGFWRPFKLSDQNEN